MSQEPILSPGSVPRISYAPNHEDILLDRIFGDHVGTFMDVGARAPTVDNLTYFFYRRGWRGVNIEPVPRRHAQLQAARPGDLNLPLAAWDANGEVPIFEVATGVGLATLSAAIAEQSRARGVPLVERRVPVRTIRSLAEELGIEPPDLLVIAAEGSEEPVIRGIALEHWRPRVFVIGSTRPRASLPIPIAWEPLLLAHGYLFAATNGVNRFYLRDDLRDHRSRLELPVSVLDRFRPAAVVALEQRVRDLEQQSHHWRIDEPHGGARLDQAEQCADLEERLARAEQGCESWQRQCATLRHELLATQRALRPYRLIDQLGVVPLGYRWARRLKPNRAT